MTSLSRPQIIKTAACPQCASARGRPCMFARCEDPSGRRAYAGQSHAARTILAKKIAAEGKTELKELARNLRL